jgi:hypothetical protein
MLKTIRILLLSLFIFSTLQLFSQTPVYFKFTKNTGTNHIIAIPTEVNPNIKGIPIADGDEIGVFTPGGLCAGAVVWKKVSTTVVAWGNNDRTQAVDGFSPNDFIRFRIYSKLQKKTYYADAEFGQAPNSSLFQPNGISLLKSLKGTTLVSVNELNQPEKFSLMQNYPNPFNPSTQIKYSIPTVSNVSIIIYDITGKEIVRLLNGETKNSGNYVVEWNGFTSFGYKASSGTYLYKMEAIGLNQETDKRLFTEVKTMMLVK